jgi:hypothetical protein
MLTSPHLSRLSMSLHVIACCCLLLLLLLLLLRDTTP